LRTASQRIRRPLAQEHAPRLRRIVGNIEFESEIGADLGSRSNFILAERTASSPDAWAGTTIHRASFPDGDVFRINTRKEA